VFVTVTSLGDGAAESDGVAELDGAGVAESLGEGAAGSLGAGESVGEGAADAVGAAESLGTGESLGEGVGLAVASVDEGAVPPWSVADGVGDGLALASPARAASGVKSDATRRKTWTSASTPYRRRDEPEANTAGPLPWRKTAKPRAAREGGYGRAPGMRSEQMVSAAGPGSSATIRRAGTAHGLAAIRIPRPIPRLGLVEQYILRPPCLVLSAADGDLAHQPSPDGGRNLRRAGRVRPRFGSESAE
jgi:hypothetical protein